MGLIRCPQCGWNRTDSSCKHHFTAHEVKKVKKVKSIHQQVIEKMIANGEKQLNLFKEN